MIIKKCSKNAILYTDVVINKCSKNAILYTDVVIKKCIKNATEDMFHVYLNINFVPLNEINQNVFILAQNALLY